MRTLFAAIITMALLAGSAIGVAGQSEEQPPASAAFEPTGSLASARTGHSAALLPDGRVLVAGGDDAFAPTEVWDPTTDTFSPAASLAETATEAARPLAVGRVAHSSTPLPDGRVLVIGGRGAGDELLATAELWDPQSRSLEPAGSMAEPRSGHTATFLRDGRVLVVGGSSPDGDLASAEVWTSATTPAKCFGKRPTLFALPGIEMVGTAGADVIAGSVGADNIRGGGGNDRICAGLGADFVDGGGGNDKISGGGGDDRLVGGKGKDVCNGGKGIDWLPGCNESRQTRGTVTITKNTKLKGPHFGRFIIGRDGITLDCDGHTITGPGRRVVNLSGIELVGRKRVTVRNCDLRDFYHGLQLHRSHRNTLRDNRVSHVGFGGFQVTNSDKNRLVANRVTDAKCCGYGLGKGSDKNRLRENVAIRGGFGFGVWESSGNVLADNIARDSRQSGFFVAPTEGPDVRRFEFPAVNNTFSGNSSIGSGFAGYIDLTTGFTGDAGTDNHYVDNTCSGNEGGGSDPATLCEESAP